MRWVVFIIVLILAGFGFAAYGPGSLNAVTFTPEPQRSELLALYSDVHHPVIEEAGDLFGSEDLEPGPDGRLYASLADGRIMAREITGGWSEVANTGGRPLGLAFGPEGTLFIADAKLGVLELNDEGELEIWLAQIPDGPLVFTDDLTVLDKGTIILTDASKRHPYGAHLQSFLEGEQTGTIYKITAPNTYEILAEGYGFINGVDHDPQTGLVYVNETWAGQTWQLNPDNGDMKLLITGLPGYPDNIEFDQKTGLIWIALPAQRSAEIDPLHPYPLLKRLVWRLIQITGEPPLPPMPAMAIAVNKDGDVVYALSGPDHHETGITTATPWQGQLWTSGLERSAIDAYNVPSDIVLPVMMDETNDNQN